MPEKVNLKEAVNSLTELFEYKKVGYFNNQMMNVLIAENRTLDFHFIIVPRGTRHRPVCKGLVKCLLIENEGTLNAENTGGAYKP